MDRIDRMNRIDRMGRMDRIDRIDRMERRQLQNNFSFMHWNYQLPFIIYDCIWAFGGLQMGKWMNAMTNDKWQMAIALVKWINGKIVLQLPLLFITCFFSSFFACSRRRYCTCAVSLTTTL